MKACSRLIQHSTIQPMIVPRWLNTFRKWQYQKQRMKLFKQPIRRNMINMILLLPFKRQLQSQQFFYLDLTFSQLNKQKSGNDNKENEEKTKKKRGEQKIERFKLRNEILSFNDSEKSTFMSYDYWLTEEMKKVLSHLINFLESGYNVTVRKITCKFILNEEDEFIFIGAKNLFIQFKERQQYIGKELSVRQLQLILQGKSLKKPRKRPKIQPKQKKRKLMKKVPKEPKIQNKCRGDFCVYFHKDLAPGVSKLPEIQKRGVQQNIKRLEIELNYFTQGTSILKTRKNLIRIIEVLKQNDIGPCQVPEMPEDKITLLLERDGQAQMEEYDNLYQRVKVCKQCYQVYCLAEQYFQGAVGQPEEPEQDLPAKVANIPYQDFFFSDLPKDPRKPPEPQSTQALIKSHQKLYKKEIAQLRLRASPNSVYAKNIRVLKKARELQEKKKKPKQVKEVQKPIRNLSRRQRLTQKEEERFQQILKLEKEQEKLMQRLNRVEKLESKLFNQTLASGKRMKQEVHNERGRRRTFMHEMERKRSRSKGKRNQLLKPILRNKRKSKK